MKLRVKRNAVEITGNGFVIVKGGKFHHAITHSFFKVITDIIGDDGISYYRMFSEIRKKASYAWVKLNNGKNSLNDTWNLITNRGTNGKSYYAIKDFSEGLAAVSLGMCMPSTPIMWNYIDTDGNVVIDKHFDEAYSFHDGFARVKKGKGNFFYISRYPNPRGETRDWIGYENKVGIFNEAEDFKDGVARVQISDKGFCIDRKGRRLWEDRGYENVGRFMHDLACVRLKNGRYIYINRKGENAFPNEGEFFSAKDFGETTKAAYVTVNQYGLGYYIGLDGKRISNFNG